MLRRVALVVAVAALTAALLVGAGLIGYRLGQDSVKDRRIDIYHHRDRDTGGSGGGWSGKGFG